MLDSTFTWRHSIAEFCPSPHPRAERMDATRDAADRPQSVKVIKDTVIKLAGNVGSNGNHIVAGGSACGRQVDGVADELLGGIEAVVDDTEIDDLAVVVARDMRDAM